MGVNRKREVQVGYKEKILPMRTWVQWTWLLQEDVPSPCLEFFKTQLDKALSNQV